MDGQEACAEQREFQSGVEVVYSSGANAQIR